MGKKAIIRLPKGKVAKNVQFNFVDGNIEVSYEVEDKFEPKDGDFLVSGDSNVFIYNGKSGEYSFGAYFGVNKFDQIVKYIDTWNWTEKDGCRFATEAEKQELFDKLKEAGKRWNPETKQIEDIRWRAEKMKEYYCIEEYNNEVLLVYDLYVRTDNKRYEAGNYFRTQEAAQKVADQIKEIFKNSKPE